MPDGGIAACAEFPNDNPGLHRGAIWRCVEVRGAPTFERGGIEPTRATLVENTRDETPTEPVAPRAFAAPDEPMAGDAGSAEETCVDAGEDPEEPIEIVDEIVLDDVIDESPEPAEASDPFATLLHVLVDVARTAAGAGDGAVAVLRGILGASRFDPGSLSDSVAEALAAGGILQRSERGLARSEAFIGQVLGWQGILRGQSEDFGACGAAALDEWCANVVARVVGNPGRAAGLKIELRRHGVAAFGLLADAA